MFITHLTWWLLVSTVTGICWAQTSPAPAPQTDPRHAPAPQTNPRHAPAPQTDPSPAPAPQTDPRHTPAPQTNPRHAPATSLTAPTSDAVLVPGGLHRVTLTSDVAPRHRLPQRLSVRWRSHIPGGLSRGLTTTAAGHLLAPSMSGYLFELDARGRPLWSAPLRAEVASPAVALHGGLRVLLTRDAELWGFDDDGQLRFRRRLQLQTPEGDALLEPAPDGSLVIAQGHDLLWVEADGALRAKTRLNARSVSLVTTPAGVLVLQHTGTASWWSGDARPAVVGKLDAPIGAHLGSGAILLAGEQRISAYDWGQRRLAVWHQTSQFRFGSAPVPLDAEQMAVRTQDNALLVLTEAGEPQRYVLGAASATPPPALDPVAGRDGTLATLSDDGRVIVISPERGVLVAQASAQCAQPRSLTSVADELLVLACAAGQLFGLGPSADAD